MKTLIDSMPLFFGSSCSADKTDDGFVISSGYDDCGFQATHQNGVLTFSNTIIGQESENTNGLLLGSAISFTVSCKFFDQRKFLKNQTSFSTSRSL